MASNTKTASDYIAVATPFDIPPKASVVAPRLPEGKKTDKKKKKETKKSEDEARMKIYSVSTRHYYAFGALVSEELSDKLKGLPGVRWVLPDSYLDVENKDYGGEPFINGQAVPYDPKYHEEWVRNNARANEKKRRNARPRNYDRSRNRTREMPLPPPNHGKHDAAGGNGMPPNMGGMPPRDSKPVIQFGSKTGIFKSGNTGFGFRLVWV
ncbi:hypothetical protein GQ457_13G003970 [Hibiscus cannabinus]